MLPSECDWPVNGERKLCACHSIRLICLIGEPIVSTAMKIILFRQINTFRHVCFWYIVSWHTQGPDKFILGRVMIPAPKPGHGAVIGLVRGHWVLDAAGASPPGDE